MPRPPIAPFMQGDLDCLCGAYAIVHAILVAANNCRERQGAEKLPLPKIEPTSGQLIFGHLVRALAKKSLAHQILNGMSASRLRRLLSTASDWLKRNHG